MTDTPPITAAEIPPKLVPVWIVSPHHNKSDFDEWWHLANTEEDHQTALDYAIARLEAGWDQCEDGDEVKVTMRRTSIPESELPEIVRTGGEKRKAAAPVKKLTLEEIAKERWSRDKWVIQVYSGFSEPIFDRPQLASTAPELLALLLSYGCTPADEWNREREALIDRLRKEVEGD